MSSAVILRLASRARSVRVLSSATATELPILGVGNVPTDGVDAVALSFTTLKGSAAGSITAWSDDYTQPAVSTIGVDPSVVESDLSILQPGDNDAIDIANSAGESTALLIDIEGYFLDAPIADPTATVAATPDPTTTPAPAADTLSGTVIGTNGVNVGSGIPVDVDVPAGWSGTSNDYDFGIVETNSSGVWTFTPPSPLPATLATAVAANGGALNGQSDRERRSFELGHSRSRLVRHDPPNDRQYAESCWCDRPTGDPFATVP